MADEPKFSGCERAAIFLMSLGEHEAAEVMKHMDVRDVRMVSEAMKSLSGVSREQADNILSDFTFNVDSEAPISQGSQSFLKRVLSQSLGDQSAPIVERLFPGEGGGVESLQLMEPEEIVAAIQDEHPQVVASALATVDLGKAAAVLAELPVSLASDAIARIARMDEISEAALEELESVMHQKYTQGGRQKARELGGLRIAAEILNQAEKGVETAVLAQLTKDDADLSEQVQENMFVFESLEALDDRGMQVLLRDVDSKVLMIALKGASSALRTLVFKNMSRRAAELLKSDLEASGPVKVSEVEEAQKSIVTSARKLAEDGALILGGSAEDFL